ncbi:MAG: NAD(P)-dependent oxidoreductase [Desulfurococcales archaeon]|nr:NAD(P)-dependent oxidoreductase [Desulfurococcales archaeon]
MRVALLGVGLMGSAAAERLASTGFDVVVWNRTREKAERLSEALGVDIAKTPMDAVSNSDAAIAFLADDEALLGVAGSIGRVDGLIFINSSTVTPRASRLAASYLESRGACYIDAPVVGGPGRVREGRLIVVASGRASCIDRVRELLDALSEKVIVVGGEPGQASAVKLAYNALLITSIEVLGESVLLVERNGVNKSLFKELLQSTVFSEFAEKYFDRAVDPRGPVGFRLELAAKDLEYAGRAAFDTKAPAPVIEAAASVYRIASVRCGELDYAKIYAFLRDPSCKTG